MYLSYLLLGFMEIEGDTKAKIENFIDDLKMGTYIAAINYSLQLLLILLILKLCLINDFKKFINNLRKLFFILPIICLKNGKLFKQVIQKLK